MGLKLIGRAPAAALALTFAGLSPAMAQIRQDVIVNPRAAGSQVLLYPDGQHVRVVRPLLQPGEPDPNAPIRLHMPSRHAVRHVAHRAVTVPKVAAVAPPPSEEAMPFSSLPTESASRLVTAEPARPVPRKQAPPVPRKLAPAPPRQAAADASMGFLYGTPAPPPARHTAPPARVATAEPDSAATGDISRRNSILFSPGAEEPAPSVLDTVRSMSGGLNAALSNGAARIQLEAFGGKQGEKSSDARRLSLKRALIIRQLLIDDGVPSERIDVRAMGGASDGALDRVDVFVQG